MAYVGDIDSALIAVLLADTGSPDGLMTMLPDVFYDFPSPGKTKAVVVKLMAHTVERIFGGIAIETPVYLVKAVARSMSGADVKSAAERIDVLLDGEHGEGGTFQVTGYGVVFTQREEYVRYDEDDPADPKVRWQHRGGMYSVFASPSGDLGSPSPGSP